MLSTVLATTLHDPSASMLEQTIRVMPALQAIFPVITVRASKTTHPSLIDCLITAGLSVDASPAPDGDGNKLGLARSQAVELARHVEFARHVELARQVELASQHSPDCILYCDFDRVLHWAENYPDELSKISLIIQAYDFTVLGRTQRAWQTHPRVQRDTEGIINHVFQLVSGLTWDVSAGARGLSPRAAQTLISGCKDENMSVDVSWPLYLAGLSVNDIGFTQFYIETEGLEFETPDRFTSDVHNLGGLDAWMNQFDAEPQRWVERIELAGGHVRAMLPFVQKSTD